MTMSRRQRKIVHLGHSLVALLVICALVASGASSAMRLFPADRATDQTDQQWAVAELVQGPPAPEEAGDNMGDFGSPNGEPAGYVVSVLIKSDSGSRTILREIADYSVTLISAGHRAHAPPTVATPSRVNSHLGRQFTLVGARPSGTS